AASVRTVVDVVRERSAALPIAVFHNDQPANDFSVLFAWLDGRESYLADADGVFADASGRSFYRRVFPDDYVDVAWSANAAHWLSRVPVKRPVSDIRRGLADRTEEVRAR